jgi:glycosyltransferase involved in cell wall biosynthesis
MSNTIPVSICIPTYNQTKYLRKTLDSIVSQTYKDFELIISDDSSTDEVEDLVFTYKDCLKIKYVRNQPSLGSPGNWNSALTLATGNYIKIMHHDDWFSSDTSLEKLVALISSNDYSFAFCGSHLYFEHHALDRTNSVTEEYFIQLKKEPWRLMLGNLIGSPSATIFKRTSLQFFDKRFIWLVDLEQYIRLMISSKSTVFTAECLITTSCESEHNLTNSCLNNQEIEIREYFLLYELLRKHYRWNFSFIYHSTKCLIGYLRKYQLHNYFIFRKISSSKISGFIGLFFGYRAVLGGVNKLFKSNSLPKTIK